MAERVACLSAMIVFVLFVFIDLFETEFSFMFFINKHELTVN